MTRLALAPPRHTAGCAGAYHVGDLAKVEVRVGVDGPGAGDDLVQLVLDTALGVPGVLREPPPACPMSAATPTK